MFQKYNTAFISYNSGLGIKIFLSPIKDYKMFYCQSNKREIALVDL